MRLPPPHPRSGLRRVDGNAGRSGQRRLLLLRACRALPSNAALRNYSFCLDKTRYCALCGWLIRCTPATWAQADRTDKFGYDPDVPTAWQANIGSNAYYPQGGASYSHARGINPPADRTATEADNVTTFYATNMTPQLQTLNGGRVAVAGGQGPRLDLQRHGSARGDGRLGRSEPHAALRLRQQGVRARPAPCPRTAGKCCCARSRETPENRCASFRPPELQKHPDSGWTTTTRTRGTSHRALAASAKSSGTRASVLRERPRRSEEHMGRHALERGSDPQFPGLVPTYDTTPLLRGVVLLAPYPFSGVPLTLDSVFDFASCFCAPVPTLFSA